jgi:hypothetical protein
MKIFFPFDMLRVDLVKVSSKEDPEMKHSKEMWFGRENKIDSNFHNSFIGKFKIK